MTNSVVKYIDQESDDKFMTSAAYICRANAYFEIIVNHQSDLIRLGHIIKNDKETLISTEIIRVAAEAKMDRKGKIQFKEISKMIKKIS